MKGIKNMEINKQLFEDVLSGKLKGTFVLRDGDKVQSHKLSIDTNAVTYPIVLRRGCYTYEGEFNLIKNHHLDIIDFIPDTNMKENELKITIPEGYEIDKENSTFEKIVFKKKDTKPRSWEEYYEQQIANKKHGYYIDDGNCSVTEIMWNGYVRSDNWKNVLPSKELAEAFLAMMQLMSLRQAWIGDWKPDWSCGYSSNYCIIGLGDSFEMCILSKCRCALSFPTKETATDFMNCFRDLLEIAKPLL